MVLLSRKLLQQPFLVGLLKLCEPADRAAVDHDLGKGHEPGELGEAVAADGVLGEVHLDELQSPKAQEVLRPDAPGAGIGRVDRDLGLFVRLVHPDGPPESRDGKERSVAGYYKTEAIVLRSFRLREADRVVHLYTA